MSVRSFSSWEYVCVFVFWAWHHLLLILSLCSISKLSLVDLDPNSFHSNVSMGREISVLVVYLFVYLFVVLGDLMR